MLHLFFGKQPWFERRGGALCARPVRWQAHALIAAFGIALIGVEMLGARGGLSTGGTIAMVVALTAMFIGITIKRTRRTP